MKGVAACCKLMLLPCAIAAAIGIGIGIGTAWVRRAHDAENIVPIAAEMKTCCVGRFFIVPVRPSAATRPAAAPARLATAGTSLPGPAPAPL